MMASIVTKDPSLYDSNLTSILIPEVQTRPSRNHTHAYDKKMTGTNIFDIQTIHNIKQLNPGKNYQQV